MTQSEQGWIKTTCAYCGVGCGVEARPKMTGELEVRGDKEHPSNNGKLCTKGIALGETVIHDGRLLSPTSVSATDRKTLDWDLATQTVADKFTQAIKEFGPESVAFYVSGQLLTEDYYVANKLIKGFMGSANIDSNSRLCMASSVVGHKRAFGSDTVPICYEDIEQAELVVLVGSNLAWCHPVLFQRLRSAKQNNPSLKVVVVDPRSTETCEIADEHLAIKPGSDVALFNGLLTHLSINKQLDTSFIAQHTNDFDQALQQAHKEHDIDTITGIDQKRLERFYQVFSKTDKVLTIYSQGVNQSTSGSDKVNSIINCHLATGKIGKPGMGPFSVTGQPNAMGGREVGALANTLASHMEFENSEHLQLVSQFWQTDNLVKKPGLKAIDMFDAMADGKIKAIWIMATNPMVSLPGSEKIKHALETCPFVVVSDCIADTETTRLADLVLPAQGWSEKSGTVTNSERRISRQRRILPSPGMAKPDWWIISQVAQKMGFKDAFNYLHEADIFREYAKLSIQGNTKRQRDFSLAGLTHIDDLSYSKMTPQQWPVTQLQTQVAHQRLFVDKRFYTANHKANFIAVKHTQPKQQLTSEFPLFLNSGRTRDQWHTMSRTGLSPKLASHKSEPYIQIHPETAQHYHIHDKQLVRIQNAQGECLARAEYSDDVTQAQLFSPIHWNSLTANNAKPCSLIPALTDPYSGQPEFKYTPVTISAVKTHSTALIFSRSNLDLSVVDYWARQKIPNGYLYRIESRLSCAELDHLLQRKLWLNHNKAISANSVTKEGRHQYVSVSSKRVELALFIQLQFDDSALQGMTEWYNTPLNDLESIGLFKFSRTQKNAA